MQEWTVDLLQIMVLTEVFRHNSSVVAGRLLLSVCTALVQCNCYVIELDQFTNALSLNIHEH